MKFLDYLKEISKNNNSREDYFDILQKACIDNDIDTLHFIIIANKISKLIGIKRNYSDNLDLSKLSKFNVFLMVLGYKNKSKLLEDWKLKEEFLQVFLHEFNPDKIIKYQNHLNEEFFAKNYEYFKDSFYFLIPKYINLSKNFIIKHASKLKWENILKYQKNIDEKLIEKCKRYIPNDVFKTIPRYIQLSSEFIDKYANYLSWKDILENQKQINKEILIKHKEKMSFYEREFLLKKFLDENI